MASALVSVAREAPLEASVRFEINVNLEVEHRRRPGPREGENALDEHDGCGLQALPARRAGVGGEVVSGDFDGAAGAQLGEVGEEARAVQGVRPVEVHGLAFVVREVREVAVVGVEGKQGAGAVVKGLSDGAGEGGFAAAGRPGERDEEGGHVIARISSRMAARASR